MICKRIDCKKQFFNEPELICLHTVKWLQVLQSNTNSFIRTQLNGFKYYNLTQVVLFNVNGFKLWGMKICWAYLV